MNASASLRRGASQSHRLLARSPGTLTTIHLRLGNASVRPYATQTSLGTTGRDERPRHKRVTVFNDDGQVKWGQLSATEKLARTTQQSFNFTLIAGGAVATLVVFFYLYADVFSPDSSTAHYDHAVNRIRTDQRCIDILGPSKEITAVESTGTSWRRARPRARTETDRYGTERMYLNFHIQGPLNKGTGRLYMLRRQDETHYSYGHLALDVPGHSRIYLENGDDTQKKKSTPGTFFGIKWR